MSIDKRTPNIYAVQFPESSPWKVQVVRAMTAHAARGLVEDPRSNETASVSKIASALVSSCVEPVEIAEIPYDSVRQHFEV